MKSTGLFGKNSGKVGGVVYSNYRGQQIVRAYQPQVNNPNSTRQIAQRAKFKLVSQVSASLRDEINMSFVPKKNTQSPRNAFMQAMLKKTTYQNNQATLPIEDVTLTNDNTYVFQTFGITSNGLTGVLQSSFPDNARVRVAVIGYSDGGEITLLTSGDADMTTVGGERRFQYSFPEGQGYGNLRVLFYAYAPTGDATNYEDYEILGERATLRDVLKIFSRNIIFSYTVNALIPRGV